MAILCAWAAYVVVINVFLSRRVFEAVVDGDPMTIDIHFERAWSIAPGVIHARGVSIRSSDNNVDWRLDIDRVRFNLTFTALIRKRFQAEHVRAEGVAMKVRQKLDMAPSSTDEIADLPKIDGLPAFAVSPAGPHSPELWSDKDYDLVSVRLEDVVATDVREVWIDGVRFAGRANIRGRFYLKPLRIVDIGPIHVDVVDGQVTRGPVRPVAQSVGGTIDVVASTFDPRPIHDNEALRFFDITTDLHGGLGNLAEIPITFPVYASGYVNAPNVRVVVRKGRVASGTDVRIESPGLLVAKMNVIGTAVTTIHAVVEGNRLDAELTLQNLRVIRPDRAELASIPALTVRADATDLDLADGAPLQDMHVAAALDGGQIEDASRAIPYLPVGVDGRAAFEAHAEAWPRQARATGTMKVRYDDVRVRHDEMKVDATGDVTASCGSVRWRDGVADGIVVEGDVRSNGVAVDMKGQRGTVRDGTFAVRVGQLRFGSALAADATVTLSAFDVAAAKGALSARARFDANGTLHVEEGALKELTADVDAHGVAVGPGVEVAHALVQTHVNDGAVDVTAKLEGGHVDDGAKLGPLALASDAGTFRGDVRLQKAGERVSGRVDAVLRGVGVTKGPVRGVTDANVALDVRALTKDRLSVGPSRVVVTNARGRVGDRVAFSAARIEVTGRAGDVNLHDPALDSTNARIALRDVAVPDATAFQQLMAPDSKVRITSGAVSVSGAIAIAGARADGALDVDVRRAGVAVEKTTLTADATLKAKVNGIDTNAQTLDLSGTHLALRDVSVTNAAAEAQHWFGDVDLDEAAFSWADGNPVFGGNVELAARDAKPILGMLLRDHAPKILASLAKMPDLRLRGHLDAAPGDVLLSDFDARGGDVDIHGAYAIRDGQKTGGFVVDKAGVKVAVRLGDDGAHPKFFGVDRWLETREKKAKAAAQP